MREGKGLLVLNAREGARGIEPQRLKTGLHSRSTVLLEPQSAVRHTVHSAGPSSGKPLKGELGQAAEG